MLLTRSLRCLLAFSVLFATLAACAVCARDAGAIYLGIKTFQSTIDVDFAMWENTRFDGVRSGCFAPYEKWDRTFYIDVDSKPTKKSTIKAGSTTVYATRDDASVSSYSFGDKGSFKQHSEGDGWELTVQNPSGCPAASAPPPWATAPTCKKTSERVSASLVETTAEGTGEGDGILQVMRVRRAAPNPIAAPIGSSCWRILHPLQTIWEDAALNIEEKSTVMTFPVPDLKDKLEKLSRGGAKARPSFKIKLGVWGLCSQFGTKHPTASTPGWTPSPYSTPHLGLGSYNTDGSNVGCKIEGSGSAVVRRVSKTNSL